MRLLVRLIVSIMLAAPLPLTPSHAELLAREASPPAATPSAAIDAPTPIAFPRDDGPHRTPIEWWYYTGHLFDESGARYGFEFVVFKLERGGIVVGYASHFALTDSRRGEFRYAERVLPPVGVAAPVPSGGFDLRLRDWRVSGGSGRDRLIARMPGYAVSIRAISAKPPVLHDGDGYIDYGDGEGSYYYSRTRLEVDGVLAVGDQVTEVRGSAWMDHQWGNFATFTQGGWDWFALQLEDGWDVMLYITRGPGGEPHVIDGTLIAPDGTSTVLSEGDFVITPIEVWTSPSTGVTYPSGWTVQLPAHDLVLTLTPVLPEQELDTRASTGQVYWEGQVTIDGMRGGRAVAGLGYVELTGYANRNDP